MFIIYNYNKNIAGLEGIIDTTTVHVVSEENGKYNINFGETSWYEGAGIYDKDKNEFIKHGPGKYITLIGDVYEGNFENDIFKGRGTYTSQLTGSKFVGDFDENGDIKDFTGEIQNFGNFKGSYINEKFNGIGEAFLKFDIKSKDNDNVKDEYYEDYEDYDENEFVYYKGYFKDNNINDMGIMLSNNDYLYCGNFIDEQKTNYGRNIYVDKTEVIYDGEWDDNLYNGKGILVTKERTQIGIFKNGHLLDGVTLNEDINSILTGIRFFEGAHTNGIIDGFGLAKYDNNDLYVGYTLTKPHIHGTYYDSKSNEIFIGFFEKGVRTDLGIIMKSKEKYDALREYTDNKIKIIQEIRKYYIDLVSNTNNDILFKSINLEDLKETIVNLKCEFKAKYVEYYNHGEVNITDKLVKDMEHRFLLEYTDLPFKYVCYNDNGDLIYDSNLHYIEITSDGKRVNLICVDNNNIEFEGEIDIIKYPDYDTEYIPLYRVLNGDINLDLLNKSYIIFRNGRLKYHHIGTYTGNLSNHMINGGGKFDYIDSYKESFEGNWSYNMYNGYGVLKSY